MWDDSTVLEHIEADRIDDLHYEPPQVLQAEASRDDFIAQHISCLHRRDQARFEEAGLRAQTLERHTGRFVVRHTGRAFSELHPVLSAEILDSLEFLADIMFYCSSAHFIDGTHTIPPFVAGKAKFHCTRPSDWMSVELPEVPRTHDAAGCTGETHTATPSSSSTLP